MTSGKKNLAKVIEDIECEGFDYALTSYDNYKNVECEEFQILYKAFLEARDKLANFLGVDI